MIPATSQLVLLSSITAINVWLGSNGISERLRSLSGFGCFGLCIDGSIGRGEIGADGALDRLRTRRLLQFRRPFPHSISLAARPVSVGPSSTPELGRFW